MLGTIIDRLRHVASAAQIVVATSDRDDDDPIAEFAIAENVALFRGAKDDVIARAHACVHSHEFERIVRICGDSPFIDPQTIDRVLALQSATEAELATNVSPRTFPHGVSVEVLTAPAMDRLNAETTDPEDREHVTRYCYNNQRQFRIANLEAPGDGFAGIRLVVDTNEDLARAKWITERLGAGPALAPMSTIAALAQQWDATHSA